MSTAIGHRSAKTDKNSCIIDWVGANVIDRERNKNARWIKEKRKMDQRGHMHPKGNSTHESIRGGYRVSHVWDSLLARRMARRGKTSRPRIPNESCRWQSSKVS